MKIGQTIKLLRKKRAMTKGIFADKAILSTHTLELIETGGMKPNEEVIKRIAEALDISIPFITFYAIDANDVPEDKKEMFELLHPHIKLLVDEILFPKKQ